VGTQSAVEGLRILAAHRSVPEILDLLESTARDKGMTVFARIDFSGDAARAGLSQRPTGLVVLGNPKGGTPLMVATPTVAIDLPLKILAWEDEAGKRWVAYNEPEYLQQRHRFPAELVKNIAGVAALAAAGAAA
jgi:uncharacterized protein (DUF302 family)